MDFKEKKIKFEKPEIDFIFIEDVDIITTSNNSGNPLDSWDV